MTITVSVKTAAEMTGLSRATIYRMFASGELVARKHGRRTLILVEDLERLTRELPPMKAAA